LHVLSHVACCALLERLRMAVQLEERRAKVVVRDAVVRELHTMQRIPSQRAADRAQRKHKRKPNTSTNTAPTANAHGNITNAKRTNARRAERSRGVLEQPRATPSTTRLAPPAPSQAYAARGTWGTPHCAPHTDSHEATGMRTPSTQHTSRMPHSLALPCLALPCLALPCLALP